MRLLTRLITRHNNTSRNSVIIVQLETRLRLGCVNEKQVGGTTGTKVIRRQTPGREWGLGKDRHRWIGRD